MDSVCISPHERARKAHARVLQAMQGAGTGTALATSMGMSESTISRLKNEHTEQVLCMLYSLGLKVVSADRTCVRTEELNMLRNTYARAVQNVELAATLFGEDE